MLYIKVKKFQKLYLKSNTKENCSYYIYFKKMAFEIK